mmetsp:Transcript_18276/g.52283  ORF Transcript_18276/g.52283 Transcript_18276/m.52283 type:complete len:236 (+) Transcript_18276:803-1510(+)
MPPPQPTWPCTVWGRSRPLPVVPPPPVVVVPLHPVLHLAASAQVLAWESASESVPMPPPTPTITMPTSPPPTTATTTVRATRPTTRRPSPCIGPPTRIGSAPSCASCGSRWNASRPTPGTLPSAVRQVGRSTLPPSDRWGSAASTAPTSPSRRGPRARCCTPRASGPSTWPCATSSATTSCPARASRPTSRRAIRPSGTRPSRARRTRTSTSPRAARIWASWRRRGICRWGPRRI